MGHQVSGIRSEGDISAVAIDGRREGRIVSVTSGPAHANAFRSYQEAIPREHIDQTVAVARNQIRSVRSKRNDTSVFVDGRGQLCHSPVYRHRRY